MMRVSAWSVTAVSGHTALKISCLVNRWFGRRTMSASSHSALGSSATACRPLEAERVEVEHEVIELESGRHAS
jgi:hypothetical protein